MCLLLEARGTWAEGRPDGRLDGCMVGLDDGLVGFEVGWLEGNRVGWEDGMASFVGFAEGCRVG